MKVLFHTNIPSPYRVDFFNELGKRCDLTVTFERRSASDRDDKWAPSSSQFFNSQFLHGIKCSVDTAFCPEIIRVLNQRWDFIVICGYATPTCMLAIEYLRTQHMPYFIEVDGGFISDDSKIAYKIKRHFLSGANGWFSTGKSVTRYLVHYGAIADYCFEYPFTSLTEDDLKEADLLQRKGKSKLKEELGISDKLVVLSVGQFIQRKGFDVLISASTNLPADCGVYIVGGIVPSEYMEQVRMLGVQNIHFISFQTKRELAKYYAAADVFVLPTRKDIWGLVINEAMSYGLPVVTTNRCVAGLELIEDMKNGYVVQAGDASALTKAIMDILADGRMRSEMSINNRIKMNEYTTTQMALKHIQVFDRRLSR